MDIKELDQTPNPAESETDNTDQKDGGSQENGDQTQDQNQKPAETGDGGSGDGGSPTDKGANPDADTGDDYKTKFSESTRESQRLLDILKSNGIDPKTGKPVEDADKGQDQTDSDQSVAVRSGLEVENAAPLSDSELELSIPGFANLEESEKEVIRNAKQTAKTIASLKNIVSELYDERVFNKEVKSLVKNEKYNFIKENLDDFTEYAYDEANRNIPLEKVAELYLVEKGATQTKEKPVKREGVETGGHGKGEAQPTSNYEFTAEQVKTMRQKEPEKYMELVTSGKLVIK